MSSECPFCTRIPCVGSNPPMQPSSGFDQVIAIGDSTVIAPTLGMLVPGYLLQISRMHVRSFACLGEERLQEVFAELDSFQARVNPVYGMLTFFEHGPGSEPRKPHGACIDHAHFHIIPEDGRLVDYVLQSQGWVQIGSIVDLAQLASVDYCYMRRGEEQWVRVGWSVPSQYIRRCLVEALSIDRSWDWGAYAGSDELLQTVKDIGSIGVPWRIPGD